MNPDKRIALVAGATGLIGSQLVKILLANDNYIKIIQLSRRNTSTQTDKLEERIINFDNLELGLRDIKADDIFCCLGTTMNQAGSKEAFRKVDYEYVVKLAEIMQNNGARQFLVVSSMGANARSSVFYNRVKGEMELTIKNIPFRAIHIFRPSLLLGKRKEKRVGEKIAAFIFKALGFLFIGSMKKYKGIEASEVANAMVNIAASWGEGIFTYESDMIRKI